MHLDDKGHISNLTKEERIEQQLLMIEYQRDALVKLGTAANDAGDNTLYLRLGSAAHELSYAVKVIRELR